MKKGFSVFELLMVMAVSSIILTNLFQIYNQASRNMRRVDRFVFEDTQILALRNRLEKDVAGMSSVWFTQKTLETKQLTEGKKMPAPENIKRNQFFYSKNNQDQFDYLTFVTTSPMHVYGQTQECFTRVVYKLEEDKKNKKLFRLMRKEIESATEDIDEKTLSKGTFYEVVDGISRFKVSYTFIDKKAVKERLKNKESDKKVIRVVSQWGVTKEDGNEEDQSGASVPKLVTVKIVFGETEKQSRQKYELQFYIPSNADSMPKSYVEIRKEEEKQAALEANKKNKGNS